MKDLFGGTLHLGVVAQQALSRDIGDGDVAAVLAENQVLAVRPNRLYRYSCRSHPIRTAM